MTTSRQSLYDRLPEIYHIHDKEQRPPDQLKAYLDILDKVQASIRDNIEALYHDFFIETCSDWVIPYLADLLGTSHLSGDPWTLRADVARTIHNRRRKGTLGAIESTTYALSGWAVHTAELRERVVWNQHLNHQRPDAGGMPPIPLGIANSGHICGAVRGGIVSLRDPALLSFLNGPFDPFAHVADVKPFHIGTIRYNVVNLAIFLWRLHDYTVPVTKPVLVGDIQDLTPTISTAHASYALRFEVHPLGEPIVLFNTHRFRADDDPPNLTHMDAVPGPMPRARLSEHTPTGKPEEYVEVRYYAAAPPDAPGKGRVGLTLHLPKVPFSSFTWRYRGANLCAWEEGLNTPLRKHEIVIDPDHGRMLFGVDGADQTIEANPLAAGLLVSATYGFSGSGKDSTGAHPVTRDDSPAGALTVNYSTGPDGSPAPGGTGLQKALVDIHNITAPRVIEIEDSRTYDLDFKVLRLGRSLHIRAASGQRPIIRLQRPLAFRPADVTGPEAPGIMADLNVKLEGLYITWDKSSTHFIDDDTALIEQAALNRLIIDNCTLDPGSHEDLSGVRQNVRYAMKLDNNYGFVPDSAEKNAFDQEPVIEINRSICGPLAIDDGYSLSLTGSIVDAASGIDDPAPGLAVHAATGDPETEWGPRLTVRGMTCFGRMRVESATGQGGIWAHRLQAHDNQQGCIKFSYFSGDGDRLPQHQACVFGTEVSLSFVSDIFGHAGYGQLRLHSDRKILEQGPDRDAMGAFGYLLNTHKWKNINIRYREFMPIGVRPILIPVT